MKFWKHLCYLIEQTLPEWRDKFLSYKYLKKQLKQICPDDQRANKRSRMSGDDENVTCFVLLLEEEIEKFNQFFMDQEEEYIIKLGVLQDRVVETTESYEELMAVVREIVDFHGEMVLLLNYSALNYIGLVKILKKYEKRSGALVRLPFIQKTLQEPFYSTDILNNLVKECEKMHDKLFPMRGEVATNQAAEGEENNQEPNFMNVPEELAEINHVNFMNVPEELAEINHVKSLYMKQTVMALEVLNKIRSGSSTVSVFSLPPV